MADVYLDEKFLGTVPDGREFVRNVIMERRKGKVSREINVRYDAKFDEVYLETSHGRVRRPLIVVSDGVPLITEKHITQLQKGELTWDDLVAQGVVEYLDAAEEENAYVAFSSSELTKEHTHLEIDPLVMMGGTASLVPYGNFSQSTRITIGAKNQKQAVGFYAENFALRVDMDVNLLHTPQNPIVKTLMHDILRYDRHPSGQNIVVAVMSFEGYNMEDAVILNRASVDYGFARSSYFRQSLAEEIRYSGGLMDTITIPDKDVKGYRSERDYRLLEEDGIIYPEAPVHEDDVIIGKTSPPRFLSSSEDYSFAVNQRRESSVNLSHGEKGVIDMVLLTESEEGNRVVQVRMRDQRIPEIGDKFTSRHGQKGVVGLIVHPCDMPFSASGITPDLLFSPHGIPSRMTVSHLLELLGGKVGGLSGRFVDGTTFSSEKEEDLRKELGSLGFREDGTEVMYSGITGEPFKARIYIGNMYYLKLKHLVANKLHARGRGPIQLLTRQPTEGRAKEGGLRLGEMEKDTFVASGASLLLKERFDSDKTLAHVCENCGMLAVKDEYRNRLYCTLCGENTPVSVVEISYAFKLLLDELKALGIYPRLKLRNKY